MNTTFEELKMVSSNLPPAQRVELAVYLMESLELPDENWTESWEKELASRLEQFRSGNIKGVPAEEVLSRMQNRVQ